MDAPDERAWDVPLSDVRLPTAAIEAATEVLTSGWLSSGPRVERFERAIAAYVGSEHAVACSSGTAALALAFAALDIGSGDEVLMPSLNFVAAANVACHAGARPVFVDVVGEDDLTLDPKGVAAAISPRTRAIVLMHYGGYPCAAEIARLAQKSGIAVVEDAAHALGASNELGMCGSWGEIGCFSFFANKNLPLGEGGMLVTSEEDLAERARRLRSHGLTTTTWERYSTGAARYDVTAAGFNYRLDELRAAMGEVMLKQLDAQIDARAGASRRYRERLGNLDRVSMPFGARPETERSAHHLAAVVLGEGLDRDGIVATMRQSGIQTSLHYPPIHRLSAFSNNPPVLPRTDAIASKLLSLPLFAHLERSQQEAVATALETATA